MPNSDPNKFTDEILQDLRWRPVFPNRFNYLSIGNDELVMKDHMFKERYDKWDELFPLPSRRRGKDDEIENSYEVTETVDEGDENKVY